MTCSIIFFFATVFAVIAIQAEAQCIFNSTHCDCVAVANPGTCTRYDSGPPTGGTCVIDSCNSESRSCDCAGTEVCTITAIDSWQPTSSIAGLNVGDTVGCIYVPSTNAAAARSIRLPSPSPSPSPTPSMTPAAPLACPGGASLLDLKTLFTPLQTNTDVAIGSSYTTTYSATESMTARYVGYNGCSGLEEEGNAFLSNFNGDVLVNHRPKSGNTEPAGGWPGICKLTGTSPGAVFSSFSAVIIESTGFTFQPNDLQIWDIDTVRRFVSGVESGECRDATAVFGMRSGVLIHPNIVGASGSSLLNFFSYTVPAAAMTSMGFSMGDTTVNGAEATPSIVCPFTSPDPCAVYVSFTEPIDTFIFLYGFSLYDLPGNCNAGAFLKNPTNACP